MKITLFQEVGKERKITGLMEREVNKYLANVEEAELQLDTAFYGGSFIMTVMVVERGDKTLQSDKGAE